LDSPDGVDSCAGEEDSVAVCGAWAGGLSDPEDVVEDAEEPLDERALELPLFVGELLIVLPGNAWAATSERTPVRMMLPAMSQRLIRRRLPTAASRV
jgi:hypothetical protein